MLFLRVYADIIDAAGARWRHYFMPPRRRRRF